MPLHDFDPLFGDAPEEVPLDKAPLAGVVAQIQFAPILMLESQSYMAGFQERIRADYPKFSQEQVQVFAPPGMQMLSVPGVTWRFGCVKDNWKVSLSSSFVSLDTRDYTSRANFTARLKSVVSALKDTVGSANVTRIGVRYVDHVKAPEVDGIADMLRTEMLGIGNKLPRDHVQHMAAETYCAVKEGNLLARWGLLPPHATHDPTIMPPSPEPSWFLDIDIFKQYDEPLRELDPEVIHAEVYALATRSYAFFRWATTDRFLDAYRGTKCLP